MHKRVFVKEGVQINLFRSYIIAKEKKSALTNPKTENGSGVPCKQVCGAQWECVWGMPACRLYSADINSKLLLAMVLNGS